MNYPDRPQHNQLTTPPEDLVGDIVGMLPSDRVTEASPASAEDFFCLRELHSDKIAELNHPLHFMQRDFPGATASQSMRPAGWGEGSPRIRLEQGPQLIAAFDTQLKGSKGIRFSFDGPAPDGTKFEMSLDVLLRPDNSVSAMIAGNSGKESSGRNRMLPVGTMSIYGAKTDLMDYLTGLLEQPMVSAETPKERKQRTGGWLGKLIGF